MKKALLWIGVLISVALLAFSLRNLKLDEFWRVLQTANLWWIAPGIALYFMAVWCRAWRWAFMLRPLGAPLSANRLFSTIVIGYMGNNIYPARIGEILRAWVLRRNEGIAMPSSLATVLLERVIDGLVMVAFVLIGLPRVPSLSLEAARVIIIALIAFLGVIAVFFWFAAAPAMAERLSASIINKVAPVAARTPLMNMLSRFFAGAKSLSSPVDLAKIVLASVVVWLLETGKYWCLATAFGLSLPFDGLMLINGVSNLFTVIPGAPGAIGTFDAGGILAAEALGVPTSLASAYILVLHVALWLPVTLLGAFFMLRQGLHWADLKQAETAQI